MLRHVSTTTVVPSFSRAVVIRSPRRKLCVSTALGLDRETRNGISLHGSPQHQTPVKPSNASLHLLVTSFLHSIVLSCHRAVVPSFCRSIVLSCPSFFKSPRSPKMCFLPRRSDHRIVPVSLPPVGHRRKWKKNPLSGYMLLPSPVAPVH